VADRAWIADCANALLDPPSDDHQPAFPLSRLDRQGKVKPSSVIVIGGRPGHGKTSFALHWAVTLARAGRKVAFLSLEMSKERLWEKCLSMEKEIDNQLIQRRWFGNGDRESITAFKSLSETWPLVIRDDVGFQVELIEAFFLKEQPEICFLDHLQMVSRTGYRSEYEALSEQVRGWRRFAQEKKIPVVLCSQINRNIAQRDDPRPRLEDLKGTGVLEEIADLIFLVYWPLKDLNDHPDAEQFRAFQIEVAKNRDGQTFTQKMIFNPSVTSFSEASS